MATGRLVVDPVGENAVQPASLDIRLDRFFRVFRNHRATVIDPREPMDDLTVAVTIDDDEPFVLHTGEFVLGATIERVKLADDLVARVEGKSSLGRLGLLVHATAGYVDPGWDGQLTLELSNVATLPIKLYYGMKIGQLSFQALSSPARTPLRAPRPEVALPGPDKARGEPHPPRLPGAGVRGSGSPGAGRPRRGLALGGRVTSTPEPNARPPSEWMRAAIEEAEQARGWSSPNPPVGAIVVRDGQIVGRGHTRLAGEEHAEVVALRDAGEAARSATFYCTLEPCSHQGRTPPCTGALIEAGVAAVHYSITDPDRQAAGGAAVLRAAGITAEVGDGAEAATEQAGRLPAARHHRSPTRTREVRGLH